MKIFKSKVSLIKYLDLKNNVNLSNRIGLVPTMGYLHEGHLKLVRKSLKENSLTIVSIFVNPIQFGPKEDLTTYPRNILTDLTKLRTLGVAGVFLPSKEAFYQDHQTFVSNEVLGGRYCGKTRPIFFRGVLTVVMKLLQIVHPNNVYFGEKDYQQLFLIKKMVIDFDLRVKVKAIPTERVKRGAEKGLALSSRNAYLKDVGKAAEFYQVLKRGRDVVRKGKIKSPRSLQKWLKKELATKGFEVDYIAVVNQYNLQELVRFPLNSEKPLSVMSSERKQLGGIILGAVYFEKVRLIDNLKI